MKQSLNAHWKHFIDCLKKIVLVDHSLVPTCILMLFHVFNFQ